MIKKLAILGASYLQLPLVKKANEMGIETHCFAWDSPSSDCKEVAHYFHPISVLEKTDILAKCKEIGIHGITTIATDICIPVISFIAKELNLTSNSLISAQKATNKKLMREALQSSDILYPKFLVISKYEDGIADDFNFPVIVKPTDRSGSSGVTKIESRQELSDAVDYALNLSLEKKVIIEEFITGDEVSIETISWQNKHIHLTVTDKETTGSPYFVELEHHQPSQQNIEVQKKLISETNKALSHLGISNGASHAEFKITPNGEVYLIEIGARMGGDFIGSHLVELSTGFDFLKAVIQVALGEFIVPENIQFKNNSGVYFLCKETERLLPILKKSNEFDFEKTIQNETLLNITNSNDRSGYLIYQADKKVIL